MVKSFDLDLGALFDGGKYTQILPVPGNFMLPAPELQIVPDLVRLSELGLGDELSRNAPNSVVPGPEPAIFKSPTAARSPTRPMA